MSFGPEFYIIAALVVFLTGMSKTGLGDGLGALAVPLMAIYVSPILAAGIMLPILCAIDLVAIWRYRRRVVVRLVRAVLPGAVAGISVGALTFQAVNPGAVKLVVAVIALWFTALYYLGGVRRGRTVLTGRLRGFVYGATSGYTSHIAHAGGPPMRAYLLDQDLDKGAFLGTMSVFFGVMNFIKLAPYVAFGQITWDTLVISISLAPMIPIGAIVGFWLHDRVPQALFTRLAYAGLLLAGLNLLWNGLTEIL